MKTMKIFLIGFFVFGSIYFAAAQTKPTAAKATAPAISAKATTQKAAVKALLPQVEIAQQIAQGQTAFAFLGKYNLYAGVQKTNIGTCTLNNDGSYTVTVNSDATNHGVGSYEYNADTKTLVWKGGLFLSNKYNGVFQKNNKLRIIFSKSTYAEKID
ncbi:hypothetical protein LBMAG23_12690 [Bacteroidota bacterium]|nr:hypothetical protein LBMAG23_12690 [Bacteroidota bacterium]